jgi:Domain of unknown function (DUF1707)
MSRVHVTEAERERAIHSLRESYAHGDLDGEQFEEKLNALFAARSSREVRELLPPEHGDLAHVLAPTVAASSTDLDTVERHLSAGEQIEWVGKPDPTKHLSEKDKKIIPGTLLIGAFLIVWMVGATSQSGGWGLAFSIPFAAVVVYSLLGRFIYKANRKRRTLYAITNRRVFEIVRNWRGGGESATAFYLSSIPNVTTSTGEDGRGSVEFGIASVTASQFANTGLEFINRRELSNIVAGFYDIEDPQGVADLVQRLRDADPAPPVLAEPAETQPTPATAQPPYWPPPPGWGREG